MQSELGHILSSVIILFVLLQVSNRTKSATADDNYDETSTSNRRHLLEAPNFRLVAYIRSIKRGVKLSRIDDELVSHEFYSNEQRRARVELHDAYREAASRRSSARSIFFYDSVHLIKQAFGEPAKSGPEPRGGGSGAAGSKCLLSSSAQLSHDLLYAVLKGQDKDGIDWLKKNEKIPDHVIGAARLLFFVDSKRSSLKQFVGSPDAAIRNHEVQRYDLIDGLKEISPKLTLIRVSYPKTSLHESKDDLPLRLVLTLSDYDQILIDYSFVGPLTLDDHRIGDDDDSTGSPLDMFALPVGIYCTDQLNTDGLWSFDSSMDVSFQAETFQYDQHEQQDRPAVVSSLGKRFVAYDGHASIMRSDSLPSSWSSTRSSLASSYSTTIVDFAHQVKFNILMEPDENLALGQSSSAPERAGLKCVAAPVSNAVAHYPFLALPGLVPVGRSTVRGVACLAFEQITNRLPANLFPHLSYLDKSELSRSSFGSTDHGESYNIVYHFAAHPSAGQRTQIRMDGQLLGALMRVDVYLNARLRYHMEVLDFVHELVEAPNGDRRDELFALRDRCTIGRLGNDGFASISMKLEALASKASQPETNERMLEEAARLLASPSARNNAIMRAIARSTSGLMKNIYDLSSRMKLTAQRPGEAGGGGGQPGKKLEIYASGRLSVHDVGLTQAKQIGYFGGSIDSQQPKQSGTFEDCFFRAAHGLAAGGGGVALLASCSSWCRFDANPMVERSADGEIASTGGYKSSQFRIQPEEEPRTGLGPPCPVFIIQTRELHLADKQRQKFFGTFRNVYSSFRDLTMAMPMPHDADRDTTATQTTGTARPARGLEFVYFKVDQVEVNNDRWSVSQGFEKAEADSDGPGSAGQTGGSARRGGETVDGIGLTQRSGSLQDATHEMNFERCHSLCMSWMKCQSFSICLTHRGMECITSEISFRDGALLERIEAAKKSELSTATPAGKGPNRRHIFQVALAGDEPLASEQAEQSSREARVTSLELKADFRCRVYKKNVLELFHKLRPAQIKLGPSRETTTTYLRSVPSLERCAELCVRNNFVFFRKMEKFERSLLGAGNDENQDQEQPQHEQQAELEDEQALRKLQDEHQRNMHTWCSSVQYLSLTTSSEADQIRPLLDPNKDFEKNRGLCLLNKPSSSLAQSKRPNEAPKSSSTNGSETPEELVVRFEAYGFRYSNLYKAQFGLQLIDTSGLEPAKGRLRNVVALMPARDAERCASMCFLQISGPEQGCRSFDFVEPSHHGPYCALNSVTLAQVERSNQTKTMLFDRTIAGRGDENFRVWHYEPRSFVLDNSMVVAASRKLSMLSTQHPWTQRLLECRLHGPAVLMILVVAFVCSSATTLLFGSRVIDRLQSHTERQRRASLGHPARSIMESFADAAESARRNFFPDSLSSAGAGRSAPGHQHHIEISDLDITGKTVKS